jgi:hypothetical protein
VVQGRGPRLHPALASGAGQVQQRCVRQLWRPARHPACRCTGLAYPHVP